VVTTFVVVAVATKPVSKSHMHSNLCLNPTAAI